MGALAGQFGGSVVQELSEQGAKAVLDEHARLRSTALKAAERSSGLTREEISDALVTNPTLIPLVTRVLWIAGMNGHDEILDVLGGVLGSILLTPDDNEEAELILHSVAHLTRTHLQVLRALHGPPSVRVKAEESYTLVERFESSKAEAPNLPPRSPDEGGYVTQESDLWNAEALAQATGLTVSRAELALAGLSRAGFAISPAALDGVGYELTSAGRVVFEAIQRWEELAPRHASSDANAPE